MALTTQERAPYAMGHSAAEQRRLDDQGAILRPYTVRLLRDAGIGARMRVLDVGCGTGDVTALAAQLVGPGGTVVGVDRAGEVLATARAQIEARGLRQVTFVEEDILAIGPEGWFDAVIGRCVLMHQPDPVATLRHLATVVRPGGVLAFAEPVVIPSPLAIPPRPLATRCAGWIRRALALAGADPDMGVRLPATFAAADLPSPTLRLDGVSVAGPDAAGLAWMAETARSLLPMMLRFGVATAAEVGIETLAERLLAEARRTGGVVCGCVLGGAWARTPAAAVEASGRFRYGGSRSGNGVARRAAA